MWMFLDPDGGPPGVEAETVACEDAASGDAARSRDDLLAAGVAAGVATAAAARLAPRTEERASDPGHGGPERSEDLRTSEAPEGVDGPEQGVAEAQPVAGRDDDRTRARLLPRARTGAYLPANGRRPLVVPSAASGDPAIMRLYLHPGRMLVGEMTADRVAGQLDMARALLFDSLSEAELAADEGAGFLVEVCEPFVDANGKVRRTGCYFLGRMA